MLRNESHGGIVPMAVKGRIALPLPLRSGGRTPQRNDRGSVVAAKSARPGLGFFA
jgi:hypothetical protein